MKEYLNQLIPDSLKTDLFLVTLNFILKNRSLVEIAKEFYEQNSYILENPDNLDWLRNQIRDTLKKYSYEVIIDQTLIPNKGILSIKSSGTITTLFDELTDDEVKILKTYFQT